MRKNLRHQEIALVLFIVAIVLFKFPLQHHITLSRFQHYGICLYVWALGFLLQLIWSWRTLTIRGRTAMISTGSYVALFALIFYSNPWLDVKMAVQTDEQNFLRSLYGLLCAVLGFVVAVIWLAWVLEDKITGTDSKEPDQ